jgi:hypothetical protein
MSRSSEKSFDGDDLLNGCKKLQDRLFKTKPLTKPMF